MLNESHHLAIMANHTAKARRKRTYIVDALAQSSFLILVRGNSRSEICMKDDECKGYFARVVVRYTNDADICDCWVRQ